MEPIRAEREDVVGYGKTVKTTATLYRDGTLLVNAETKCTNNFHGLRARITVLILDGNQQAIGVSQEMRCTTRGGVLDIFTPSSGRDQFRQRCSDPIGERAVSLEISQSDDTGMGGDKLMNLLSRAKEAHAAVADL
ncbi:hypothetical protein SCHPADRAFT_44860 [Schizopora paradoxa]|uniref:Uncharacterized protein n=1 Tax=Schizopora paradoxa TaxID=27342 RepID=A0A0H2SRX5_9AGAM|nr:hypothetical protein SCHPADRAFT_44860 [Schizopora paradoxa]